MEDSYENIVRSLNRKPKIIETDSAKEFVSKIIIAYLNKNNSERYSRYTSRGAVIGERFSRSIRDVPKKTVFEKGNERCIDEMNAVRKQ